MKKSFILAAMIMSACASGLSDLPENVHEPLKAQNETIKSNKLHYVCFDKEFIQTKFPEHVDWYEVEERGYCKVIDETSRTNVKNYTQFQTALITGWAAPGKIVDSYIIETEDEFSQHFVTRSKIDVVSVIEGEIGKELMVDIDKVTPGYLKQSQKVLKSPYWFFIENDAGADSVPTAFWEHTGEMICFGRDVDLSGLDSALLFVWQGTGQTCLDLD